MFFFYDFFRKTISNSLNRSLFGIGTENITDAKSIANCVQVESLGQKQKQKNAVTLKHSI